jgi:hypothetical protein
MHSLPCLEDSRTLPARILKSAALQAWSALRAMEARTTRERLNLVMVLAQVESQCC